MPARKGVVIALPILVGSGFAVAGENCRAHAFRWDAKSGMVDLGSTVEDRSSRANGVAADGSVIYGWQDADIRQGARWIDDEQFLFADAQASTPDVVDFDDLLIVLSNWGTCE